MLSRGLNGKETGEGTGICPRDVLCIDCVRVLNGSFLASFLVKGIRIGDAFCCLHLFALCSSFTSFVFFIYFMCLPYCFLHLLCLLS